MTVTGASAVEPQFDLLVIGGGINGAGVARDASGRGLRVVLGEQGDLASATSSASTKLIHGGLRYLEYYEFRLVRNRWGERAVLLALAPHIVWPLGFVLPHDRPCARPGWCGLACFSTTTSAKGLGGGLPGTRRLNLRAAPQGAPLQQQFTTGFEYSDAWVDDARLVVLNALGRPGARRHHPAPTRAAPPCMRRTGTGLATLDGGDGRCGRGRW